MSTKKTTKGTPEKDVPEQPKVKSTQDAQYTCTFATEITDYVDSIYIKVRELRQQLKFVTREREQLTELITQLSFELNYKLDELNRVI